MIGTPKSMLHPRSAERLRAGRGERINANLTNFISWSRLVEELRASGEIKASEEVEAFVVTDEGLQYYVRRR